MDADPTSIYNPYDPAFIDDPYPTYTRLRDEAPVLLSKLGFYVISRFDDVMALLRDDRCSREHWRLIGESARTTLQRHLLHARAHVEHPAPVLEPAQV